MLEEKVTQELKKKSKKLKKKNKKRHRRSSSDERYILRSNFIVFKNCNNLSDCKICVADRVWGLLSENVLSKVTFLFSAGQLRKC